MLISERLKAFGLDSVVELLFANQITTKKNSIYNGGRGKS